MVKNKGSYHRVSNSKIKKRRTSPTVQTIKKQPKLSAEERLAQAIEFSEFFNKVTNRNLSPEERRKIALERYNQFLRQHNYSGSEEPARDFYLKTMRVWWQNLSREEKESFLKDKPAYMRLKYALFDKPKSKWILSQAGIPGISISTTGLSAYDDMLKNPRYFEVEKDSYFTIDEITADEYMLMAYELFSKNDSRATWESATRTYPHLVEKYAKMMKEGVLFDMPLLDFKNNWQEGRHRVMAFEKAFGKGKRMPVMIVKPYDFEKEESLYAIGDD